MPTGPEVQAKVERCHQIDTAAVSPGLVPTFSWTPACGVGEVSVYEVGDTLAVWSAFNLENQIASPVTYGVTPAGASARAARPLQAGKSYRLLLGTADPPPLGGTVIFVVVLQRQDFDR